MPFSDKMSEIRIISLNVNSIVGRGKRLLLENFIGENPAEIYLIQETKLKSNYKFRIPNFNIFRNDTMDNSGGTAILVDENIPIREFKIYRQIFEATFIEIKLHFWLRVASIYWPPGRILPTNELDDFFNTNIPSIYGGDFNARHPSFGDYSSNAYGEALAGRVGIKILNPTLPTCYKTERGSYIDKFLFHNTNLIHSEILNIGSFSDHDAIMIKIPTNKLELNMVHTPTRDFNNTNMNRLNTYIERKIAELNLGHNENYDNESLENLAQNFNSIMREAVKRHVPLQRPIKRNLASSTTLALQNHCKKLQRKLFRLGPIGAFATRQTIIRELKLIRSMLINSINSDARLHYNNAFNVIQGNISAYRVIRRFTDTKIPKTSKILFIVMKKKHHTSSGPEI